MGIIRKVCNLYPTKTIITKPTDLENILDDVFTTAITKSLMNYTPAKGKFSTYFYYKILSSLRVELGKYKRRFYITNTAPLKDEIYKGEEEKSFQYNP